MTRRQIEQFRRQLVDSLTALYRDVHGEIRESMLRDFLDPDQPRDELDESQRTQLRDPGERLAEAEAARAQQIEEAIRRIDKKGRGEFGVCVECGTAIDPGRLKAIPWVARCLDCQQAEESARGSRPPTM